jgi:hypothetical protein
MQISEKINERFTGASSSCALPRETSRSRRALSNSHDGALVYNPLSRAMIRVTCLKQNPREKTVLQNP